MKCVFCVKIVILESISFCVFLICYRTSMELPEDAADKLWKASELYLKNNQFTNSVHWLLVSVTVAARSKSWVCGRSFAETAGYNPTEGIDVCLLWVLCVVRKRYLRWADHSSRGVLPTVVRRYVWSRNLVNEETMAHWVFLDQKQTSEQTVGLWPVTFVYEQQRLRPLWVGTQWYIPH